MKYCWSLPKNDPWSTPFAETLLNYLEICRGDQILDIASGSGIPAFYLAEQVGPKGSVLAIDINQRQVLKSRSIQGNHLPWLRFEVGDMRFLPADLPKFDRITGNLSFMFFRPNRFDALQNLVRFLKPSGQIVLTFPSMGTFDSLWKYVDKEMSAQGFVNERKALDEYINERPSASEVEKYLKILGLEKIIVGEQPLEVATGSGIEFLEHPLLRGGFLDDIYECFQDQGLANTFMDKIAEKVSHFTPLYAIRCAMSGWKPNE